MRVTLLAAVAVGVVYSTQVGAADPRALPLCNDINISDEQIQAAVDAAIRKKAAEGTLPENINAVDFIVLFRQMAANLGCRLPDADTTPPKAPGGGRSPSSSQ